MKSVLPAMQQSLELTPSPDPACEKLRIGNTHLHYWPHFYPDKQADRYLHELIHNLPWRQDVLNFGGRKVPVPRLQAWIGDPASQYGYSGLALQPHPWTSDLLSIKQRIEQYTGVHFNAVLANYYRDGNDSVSWHRDNEKELGTDPIVASVSFGVSRRFDLKHCSDSKQNVVHCELQHGSLLLMGKGIQKNWLHRVPKQPGISGARINLTYRLILPRDNGQQVA